MRAAGERVRSCRPVPELFAREHHPRRGTNHRHIHRPHFLHAAAWASSLQARTNGTNREVLAAPFGTHIGHYVVHFANGDRHDVPIIHGQDVREWWHWRESLPDPKELVVAWTGTNAANRAANASVRLFKSSWKNSHPEVEITSIDFISALKKPAPFLIAITTE